MYAVRGLAVSISIFVLLYSGLSAVVCVWPRILLYGQRRSASRCADLLFAIRLAPFVVATGLTLFLAVPSFLLLEPRTVNEPIGAAPMLLTFCGIAMMVGGVWNAAASWTRASRTVAGWWDGNTPLDLISPQSRSVVSVFRSSNHAPPLTAAGVLRTVVWLSGPAESALNGGELQAALRHEFVHVRRRDNLRKLILRLVAFPGTAALENAWREAAEMAADDAAVSSSSEALDLAAAVIKLSRLFALEAPTELTTALVQSPAEFLNLRVERLLAWAEPQQQDLTEISPLKLLCFATPAAVTLFVSYGTLLMRIHAATEWLVR